MFSELFDFMFCPEPTCVYEFKPIDIGVTFSSRPTTAKKKETKKPVDSFETKQSTNRRVKIRDVIFSDPATVVFWNDNTKTVVKNSWRRKIRQGKGPCYGNHQEDYW